MRSCSTDACVRYRVLNRIILSLKANDRRNKQRKILHEYTEYFKKWRGIVTADGQDVAVAFVFVFVIIDSIHHHHHEPITLVVIAERTVLH